MGSTNCNTSNMQFLHPPVTASLLSPNALLNTSFLDIPNRTKFKESTASTFVAENTRISSLRFGDVPV
jgi:hypothetical protein